MQATDLGMKSRTDPDYKQLIPYVLFCHDDGGGCKTLFQYTRGTKQDESRLRGRRSVGIGGHIATRDIVANGHANAFSEGMQRELAEEVSIKTPYSQQCVGLINDDETPVGRVHLGIVYLFDVERHAVFARKRNRGRRFSARAGNTPPSRRLRDVVADLPAGAVQGFGGGLTSAGR